MPFLKQPRLTLASLVLASALGCGSVLGLGLSVYQKHTVSEGLVQGFPANALKPKESEIPDTASFAELPAQEIQLQVRGNQVLITPEDVQPKTLLKLQANELARPNRLVCNATDCYFLARGQLYALSVATDLNPDRPVPAPLIQSRRFQLPTGEYVRELSDLSLMANGQLALLDKSNDLYLYTPAKNQWQMALKARPHTSQPDPHFIALAHYEQKLYLLDYARNQIWRWQTPGQQPRLFFRREVMSWDIKPGDHNLVDGIDLTIDGDIYVLTRTGQIHRYQAGKVLGQPWLDLNTLEQARPLKQPLALRALRHQGPDLYVVDAGNQQILQIDKHTRQLKKQWILADNQLEWHLLHDLAFAGDKMLALAGNQLLALPEQTSHQQVTLKYQDIHPVDQVLKGFQKPIASADLPDNAGIYPGARRLYRRGIHEGADFYDPQNPQGGGAAVRYGSEVRAVQAGTVIRADHGFQEMTPAQRAAAVQDSVARHETSRENEDRFRGQQVWIKHAQGVVSIYAHLSGIPPQIQEGLDVKQGDLIGYVGNSGISDGVGGSRSNPHLHLEIWLRGIDDPVNGEYLGKWLSLPETRAIWERVFQPARN